MDNNPFGKFLNKFKDAPVWVWWLAGGLTLVAIVLASALGNSTPVETSPFEANPVWTTISFIIKLAVVIGLIYVVMFFAQRWRGSMKIISNNKINLLETFRLSPKQSLHLIKVGEDVMLLGATDQGINLISNIDSETLSLDAQTQTGDAAGDASFQKLFSKYTKDS